MPLKIICAGPCRTGTKSFSAALRHFGYTVYDFEEHCFYHGKEWGEIIQHGHTKEMFQKMYADVDAVADLPAFYFWEELLEAFPDAKVVSMERDEESWSPSWQTVNDVWANRPLFYQIQPYLSQTAMQFRDALELSLVFCFGMPHNSFARPWNRVTVVNKQLALKRFRDHLELVRMRAQKYPTRHLAYNITQGWEPLCKFLGLEVPDIPFPHLNKGANMINRMVNDQLDAQVNKETAITLAKYGACITAITLACVYCRRKGSFVDVLNEFVSKFSSFIRW